MLVPRDVRLPARKLWIAFAVGSPARMNVSFMEVLPTLQVVGGLNFARGPTKSGQQA